MERYKNGFIEKLWKTESIVKEIFKIFWLLEKKRAHAETGYYLGALLFTIQELDCSGALSYNPKDFDCIGVLSFLRPVHAFFGFFTSVRT